MAIVTIPGGLWLPAATSHVNEPQLSMLNSMTASGHRSAFIVQAPHAGVLDSFEVRQTHLGGTTAGVRFSFQDLDSSGNPDGTQDQYRVVTALAANSWIVPPGPLTHDGTNGGTKRTVAAGDLLACVIEFESFVASDFVRFAAMWMSSNVHNVGGSPSHGWYGASYNGTSWAKSPSSVIGGTLALKYTDGYAPLPFPWVPANAITARAWSSSSSPAQRGIRLTLPFPARVAGAWVRIDLDANADLVLYDASDTVLATLTLASAHRQTTDQSIALAYFDTPVTLAAGEVYRLAVKPTTTTNVRIWDLVVNAADLMAAVEPGATWYSTTGAPGGWTDTTTERPFMGLYLDGFEAGAGGGGGGGGGISRSRVQRGM